MVWVDKLKAKWGITSNRDFVLIMLAFSMAGMMITFCRKPIFHVLGISDDAPLWLKTIVYIPLIIPLYQVFLLFWGSVLGQFNFFWEKEKRLGRFLRGALSKTFSRKRESPPFSE